MVGYLVINHVKLERLIFFTFSWGILPSTRDLSGALKPALHSAHSAILSAVQ
jgi:hypothetical protein